MGKKVTLKAIGRALDPTKNGFNKAALGELKVVGRGAVAALPKVIGIAGGAVGAAAGAATGFGAGAPIGAALGASIGNQAGKELQHKIPKFHHGGQVQNTGLAILKRGEVVIPNALPNLKREALRELRFVKDLRK